MKIRNPKTRLIVAASDTDPDMLYATKFWAPDPFIFLERNGKRTLDRTSARPATVALGTGAAASFRIRVEAIPAAGYAHADRELRTVVHAPRLAIGSRGPSVLALAALLPEFATYAADADPEESSG